MRIQIAIILIFISFTTAFAQKSIKPNIILIVTDDQGYGDLGIHGNPYLKTPNIDKLGRQSTRLTNYHNSPVCAPTRSSLLTGRYHQRTGVRDTWNNGAIMATEEITLAEIFSQNNYQTGIVGKWHLGDNYPFRPSEQGFQYSFVHGGGGIGQPGDDWANYLRADSCYFNSVVVENNQRRTTQGYCTDVFTDEALKFIQRKKNDPFFLYVTYNAPHDPLQVPQKYYDLYKDLKFDTPFDQQSDQAWSKMTDKDKEEARRSYAMITNIDDNVGRIVAEVKKQSLEEKTIIIFMTDNGNARLRYNGGFKGQKGSAYEGGTRVPFFISGKGIVPENKEVTDLLAHIDVLPTLLDAANITLPKETSIDGQSAWSIIQGKSKQKTAREFYNDWNRGYPEPYRNAAYYKGDYKIVAINAVENDINTFGLYNLKEDPYERNNLVTTQKEKAWVLKKSLDSLFADLSASPRLTPRRIQIGTAYENPTLLNRQDWSGNAIRDWRSDNSLGTWTVTVKEDGYYTFKLRTIQAIKKGTRALVRLGQIQRSKIVDQELVDVSLDPIYLTKGDYDLETWFELNGTVTGPFTCEVSKK